jgi:hypothetical protein
LVLKRFDFEFARPEIEKVVFALPLRHFDVFMTENFGQNGMAKRLRDHLSFRAE